MEFSAVHYFIIFVNYEKDIMAKEINDIKILKKKVQLKGLTLDELKDYFVQKAAKI